MSYNKLIETKAPTTADDMLRDFRTDSKSFADQVNEARADGKIHVIRNTEAPEAEGMGFDGYWLRGGLGESKHTTLVPLSMSYPYAGQKFCYVPKGAHNRQIEHSFSPLKMDGAQLKVYSRNCRLSLPGDEADGEQTFPITPKYLPVVEKNRAAMLALGPGLSVFGELFGGAYPGVKSAGKPVQREVMYCGHYEFFVFDVYDHATEKFWDFGKTLEVCTEAGLSVVPVIKRCNFDELAEFLNAPDFERLTSVPARFDLPDLPNNVLEGYVVRPAHEPTEMDFKHGRRAYKARTKAYRETKSMGGGKMAQTMAPDTEVDAWFLDRLTPQRLTNAMSKEMDEELTTKLIAKYIGLLYDDVLKEKDFEGEVDVRRMKTHIGNFLRNELKL